MERGIRKEFGRFDTMADKIEANIENDALEIESAVLKAGHSLDRIPRIAEKMASFVGSLGTVIAGIGNIEKKLYDRVRNLPEFENDSGSTQFHSGQTLRVNSDTPSLTKSVFPKMPACTDAENGKSPPRLPSPDPAHPYWDVISAEYETLGEQLENAFAMLEQAGKQASPVTDTGPEKRDKTSETEMEK